MGFLRCEKGIAMPLVLMIMVVLLLLGVALWHYSISDLLQSQRAEDKTRAYYVARAGAESLARHVIQNPQRIDEILDGDEENISDYISLDTVEHGTAGDLEVSIKQMEGEKLEITGIGRSNGVRQSVSIVFRLEPFPDDAAVIATGVNTLNFDEGMTVEGSIVAGGDINLPDNFDDTTYSAIANNPFPPEYFTRVEVPENPDNSDYEDDISLNQLNDRTLEINAGSHVEYNELSMGNQDTLKFNTIDNGPTILVVDKLQINGGTIEITGDGRAQIYVRTEVDMRTPNTDYAPDARLELFLAEGCDMTLRGNNPFDGLIYGPYNTRVSMQGNPDVHGAMIVENLSGTLSGGGYIGNPQSLIEFFRGFEDLEFQPIVNMLYWKPE